MAPPLLFWGSPSTRTRVGARGSIDLPPKPVILSGIWRAKRDKLRSECVTFLIPLNDRCWK